MEQQDIHFVSSVDSTLKGLFSEHIERYTLENGLTVLLQENHTTELASAQLWVKTGSIYENALLGTGISHFTEHMLFKGTKTRNPFQITSSIQAIGGHINAYTTFDRTVYYIDLPSEKLESALDILSDIVFYSLFSPKEALREKEVIFREIDMSEDDPDRLLSQLLFETAFTKHPYRYPIIGLRSLFQELTCKQLSEYYHTHYIPNNMVLVIAGALDIPTLKKEIEKIFGKIPRKPMPLLSIPSEPKQLAKRHSCKHSSVNVVRGCMAFKIPHLSHPDTPGLDLLASLLGHGNSSILWQALREEKKLVHHIDASTWNPGSCGLLWISYLCDAGKRETTEIAIQEQLTKLNQKGLTKERIQKAIHQAVSGEINLHKTVSGQASHLGIAEVVIGDIGYPKIYFDRLLQVDVEELRMVTGKYLQTEQLSCASLEPNVSRSLFKKKSSRDKEPTEFSCTTLPSGIRLLLQPHHSLPKVHLRTICLGGPLYEPSQKRGITTLMSTLLTKDTSTRTATQVAEAIESVGGHFAEFVGNNTFGLEIEVLPNDLDRAIDILQGALQEPVFNEKTFLTERKNQIAQIKENEDEIFYYGMRRLRQKFFGSHPYRDDIFGTCKTVQNLNPQAIQDFFQTHVVSHNVIVAVSGSFDPNFLTEKLSRALHLIPQKSAPKMPLSSNHIPSTPGYYEETLEREQAVLFDAYPSIGIFDQNRYYITELLNELFNNMASQLFTRVREEKGLAYCIGANRLIGASTGMFYFYAGTEPKKVPIVQQEIETEIRRVQNGKIPEEEMMRCKAHLKAQKRISLQSISARAMHAALNATYHLPIENWKRYDACIEQLTAKDLQKYAEEYFSPEKRVTLVVRPPKCNSA